MQKVARAAIRRLSLGPGVPVIIDVDDATLREALESLLGSAGAEIVDAGPARGAVVEVPDLAGALVPERVQAAVTALDPGGVLVVIARAGATGRSVEALAEHWRPCLGLARAHGEPVEGVVLLSGPRRAALSGAERKRLRGLAHAIEPSVLVGKSGLTDDVVEAARAAVERHGLIKVKLTPQAVVDKHAAAREIAFATGAELVQQIGKTALIFRPDVPLEPPVKRSGRR
ncbi:MAG: YhbY family RNA-binding protein [Deltaproteobacteria bacterium]|nr:YhbY family RNA-binding protein [Deltaproteobacteria bacterium]